MRGDVVRLATFADLDRQLVAIEAKAAVETEAPELLARYAQHPHTFGGRYICADTFKELFPAYAASREARNRYNNPVHNAAAVLASMQFERVASTPGASADAIFITGVPGAGKSSSVQLAFSHDLAHLVYEGQLIDPATSLPKIELALTNGLRPTIIALQADPELALDRTFQRFCELGRGASADTMARILVGTAAGLAEIHREFGDRVNLLVRSTSNAQSVTRQGWSGLDILTTIDSHDDVRNRLERHAQRRFAEGRIDEACLRQARGLAPVAGRGDPLRPHVPGHGPDADRRPPAPGRRRALELAHEFAQREIPDAQVRARFLEAVHERLVPTRPQDRAPGAGRGR